MARAQVGKDINAPLEKVWAIVTDLGRWEEWNTLLTKWKSTVPEDLTVGTTVTAVLTIMGMANTITLTVDELTAPSTFEISGTGMAGARISMIMHIAPHGDTTRFEATAEFTSAMMVGPIGGAIARAATKDLESSLGKLAGLVE